MKNKKALITKYLDEKYHPELVFLYGSFATNTSTSSSDIDCICFTKTCVC